MTRVSWGVLSDFALWFERSVEEIKHVYGWCKGGFVRSVMDFGELCYPWTRGRTFDTTVRSAIFQSESEDLTIHLENMQPRTPTTGRVVERWGRGNRWGGCWGLGWIWSAGMSGTGWRIRSEMASVTSGRVWNNDSRQSGSSRWNGAMEERPRFLNGFAYVANELNISRRRLGNRTWGVCVSYLASRDVPARCRTGLRGEGPNWPRLPAVG